MISSYFEATARARVNAIVDPGSFHEILPPTERTISPHLTALDLPVAFDDGIVIGVARMDGMLVCIGAQEGGFMGGAAGEIQAAKLVGLLARARRDAVAGVVLLLESGGVRLQEANAGLIGVSEVIRAILVTRGAGIPVVACIGGQYGCFGGMGIAAACCTRIVMSEEGRLGLSGPEVIEIARGVDEFDARDKALVWRTTGGKHRYLLGDCDQLVDDRVDSFRRALVLSLRQGDMFDLAEIEREHAALRSRLDRFGTAVDATEIWAALGLPETDIVSILPVATFVEQTASRRLLATVGGE